MEKIYVACASDDRKYVFLKVRSIMIVMSKFEELLLEHFSPEF